MSKVIKPVEDYKDELGLRKTQYAIKQVKEFFQKELALNLNLTRVSAPLFVDPKLGLNDNLNGVERPVNFDVLEQKDSEIEVVQSLAKWKRYALDKYGFNHGEGIYADMSAIRRDEETDNLHSIYVDQWDWERILYKEERNEDMLKRVVRMVYEALRSTEIHMSLRYDYIKPFLPDEIFFITAQELLDMYPDLTPKEREDRIVREHNAVFIMQIGKTLSNGERHDGRAPDYDDWELNGDIIVYYPVLDMPLELSSMGIRVSEESLAAQLKEAGCEERAELPFHKAILEKKLPYTIGGGIGQSRICMFFLRKAHVGEVQTSVWPEEDVAEARQYGMNLL
ncbi:MAG: aspartate--ammonia ligase [Lachnospiraceae bacterium]|nr:aspartate--ammonia ligase [Lachnospiraceae bacterium]